jgi:heme A synthase
MFAASMIGFLLAMAIIVWLAVVIGVPQPYVALVVLFFVVLAAVVAVVAYRRARRPRP